MLKYLIKFFNKNIGATIAFYVDDGGLSAQLFKHNVRPTLYLEANLEATGEGTKLNPYVLK